MERTIRDLMNYIHELEQQNADLTARNAALMQDSAYGCLSRAGLEAHAHGVAAGTVVVFGDIDHMHAMNARLGSYAAVDMLIKHAIQATRTRRGELIGRYYSGDELLWCIDQEDVHGFLGRIHAAFAQYGLSITLGYAVVREDGMMAAAAEASATVQSAKAARDAQGGSSR